jgi:hypothetical protein
VLGVLAELPRKNRWTIAELGLPADRRHAVYDDFLGNLFLMVLDMMMHVTAQAESDGASTIPRNGRCHPGPRSPVQGVPPRGREERRDKRASGACSRWRR